MCIDGTCTSLRNFGESLIVIPTVTIFAPVVTVAGVVATILNPTGHWKWMNQWNYLLNVTNAPLQVPFDYAVSVINPSHPAPGQLGMSEKDPRYRGYQHKPEGLLTKELARSLVKLGVQLADDKRSTTSDRWAITAWFKEQVCSRLAFALYPVVAAVTRVADFAFGLVAATFAISFAFGRSDQLNQFAKSNLSLFGIASDICVAVRGIVYPQQFLQDTLNSF